MDTVVFVLSEGLSSIVFAFLLVTSVLLSRSFFLFSSSVFFKVSPATLFFSISVKSIPDESSLSAEVLLLSCTTFFLVIATVFEGIGAFDSVVAFFFKEMVLPTLAC